MVQLAKVIRSLSSLTSLNMSGSSIGVGWKYLRDALRRPNNLKFLALPHDRLPGLLRNEIEEAMRNKDIREITTTSVSLLFPETPTYNGTRYLVHLQ